jgi:hypothetical protein
MEIADIAKGGFPNMGDPLRSQVGLALLQLAYDLVAFHRQNHTARGVKKQRSFAALFLQRKNTINSVR